MNNFQLLFGGHPRGRVTIQLRRDTNARWVDADPILLEGEPSYVTDTKRVKVGDGTTPWSKLPFVGLIAPEGIVQGDWQGPCSRIIGFKGTTE